MKVFWAYCRSRWRGAALFALFAAVFAAVFALYGLPAAAAGYGALLCAFLGALLLGLDFLSFRARHRRLRELREELIVTSASLPRPRDLLEADYQAALRELWDDRRTATEAMDRRYAELVEYYTVWAHQIKTPIAAMRLLLAEAPAGEERELREELQRIEQYADMVLCYLRLDSESTDYVIKWYDLDAILRQAVRKYSSQFIRRKLRLCYAPVRRQVLTDEKWLLFVLEQLLSNAVKYTPAGSVSLTWEEPGTLVVADTGIGIAPEDLPRVFERGFTGYNGRSDKKASGIGLYLCRRILEKLGHGIRIESEPGRGTRVYLALDTRPLEVE